MNQPASPRANDPNAKTEKILGLQEELLSVRKEMSKKQSQWEKERSNLLSKNEVANIQIIQLKQRIANLTKINETLSNAMTSNGESLPTEKSQAKLRRPKPLVIGEEVSDFSCQNRYQESDSRRRYQEEVKKLNKIISEKDLQIGNLNKIGNELRAKLEERNLCVGNLEEVCFDLKRKVEKKQEQILKLHKQIQEVEERLEENNQYIDETRRKSSQFGQQNQKRQIELDQSSAEYVKKYTKNSSYLIMKPTPDHSGYEGDASSQWNEANLNEPDYDSEEEEKLLCEVCNRVFSFAQFEGHLEFCGHRVKNESTRQLFEKKKQIESRLERIRLEQEKENLRSRQHQPTRYDFEDSKESRDKIMQIREIAKGLSGKREGRRNPYNDFSIKSNAYY